MEIEKKNNDGKKDDENKEKKENKEGNKPILPETPEQGKPAIAYADFAKIELRVAEIANAEDVEGADKLYKLTLKIGGETRVIASGIKENYSKEELIGKKIAVIYNLQPRKIRGIESNGMLLAASSEDHSKIIVLEAAQAENGWKIS